MKMSSNWRKICETFDVTAEFSFENLSNNFSVKSTIAACNTYLVNRFHGLLSNENHFKLKQKV